MRLVYQPPQPRLEWLHLYELYSYDFSEIHALDVRDDGRYGSDDLLGCWTDSHRHPFFIKLAGQLVGFAIVDRGSHLSEDKSIWDMAEFFVMRRYRRRGFGKQAAINLFGMFPGKWEVRQSARNLEAHEFWRRVIARFTHGNFSEFVSDSDSWRGPVQCFRVPAAGVIR